MRPAALVLLALVAAAAAGRVWLVPDDARPSWIDRWERSHPDGRPLAEDEAETFRRMKVPERREDATSLLAAVACGALVAACARPWTRRLGLARAMLLGGSLGLGAFHVGLSMWHQHRAGVEGTWTLGDDALDAMTPRHADTLRAWRARVPEGEPVLLVGRNNFLRGVVAYALFPRPLHPVVVDVPAGMGPDRVRAMLGDAGPGASERRWVVDLGALAEGREPALIEVAP